MRRVAVAAALAGLTLALAAPGASAHPLGNFSINHQSRIEISDDRIDVRYLLDQAEIPTLEERDVPRAELLEKKRGEILPRLELTVDGRAVALTAGSEGKLQFRKGQGGLQTLRVELNLRARVNNARRVELRDGTYPGRVGWKAVVSAPGEGTAVRTDAPSGDPTDGLRRYPEDLLSDPLDTRSARFSVNPGDGTLVAPKAEGGEATTTTDRGGDGLVGVFEDAALGEGVLLLLLVVAFGWGALHALSPGHGKAMVAAYLVGTRGTARHALALGATVTVTHTIGVFALGLVTLALSQYVLPEDLYPWLTLASGLLVVLVGAAVLRSRIRWMRERRHAHGHHHHHHGPDDLNWRGLLGIGTAAGLIPCPSALVVLLAAISQHEVALGLLLIVAFSLGLAATLTGLGLGVVYAKRLLPRLDFTGRVGSALPAASALVIVAVGCLLAARAVPEVVG
jgi:nickel/cobalt exporter